MDKCWMNWVPATCAMAMLGFSGGCRNLPCHSGIESDGEITNASDVVLDSTARDMDFQPTAILESSAVSPVPSAAVLPAHPKQKSRRVNRMVDNLRSSDVGLRLATIDLIKKCAEDGFSYQTERADVNGETTLEVVRLLAYGVDRDGCWAEEDD